MLLALLFLLLPWIGASTLFVTHNIGWMVLSGFVVAVIPNVVAYKIDTRSGREILWTTLCVYIFRSAILFIVACVIIYYVFVKP